MKNYSKYSTAKSSQYSKLPSHWIELNFKQVLHPKNEKPVNEDDLVKIGLEHIISGTGQIDYNETEYEGTGCLFENEEILFGKLRPYLAKVWLAKFRGQAVGDFYVFATKEKGDPKYYKYYIISDGFIDLCNSATFGAKMPRVNWDFIQNIKTPLPPLPEQKAIATYLDEKTTLIDALIEKTEKKIALLQEQRTAIINQAVTKGLDPKAKMKDSGVEWIGEIPEGWEVKKLKYLSRIVRGAILRPVNAKEYFNENGEWTYLNISDATKVDKYLHEGKLKLSELGSTKSFRVAENNLIITASATIGKPFITKIPVCVHDGFIPLLDLKVNIDFLYYFFKNPMLFVALGKSNTQKNIYLDEVKNIFMATPPISEQNEIVSYLDKITNHLDLLILQTKKRKEILSEYRQALISEVVTGKICVLDEIPAA